MTRPIAILSCLVFLAGCSSPNDPHPDTSAEGWTDLFKADLSDAQDPKGVWSISEGVITASEDFNIWSPQAYDNFILDLEFKTAEGTNSGVVVYCSDIENWIPNSVEIQIADDYSKQWSEAPPTWQCGAAFGRLAASERRVKNPGEWNRYTIVAQDKIIEVILNGALVTRLDMSRWTSATKNPDGSDIPSWLNKPLTELPTQGHIGFQGKHAGAPIYFRNIRVKEL
jgi:hypothetical protein